MDYTKQPLLFQLRKALRYARLYGPRRTAIKIRGQYHMRKHYPRPPALNQQDKGKGHVGLIGCGNFAFTTIAYYLDKCHPGALRAAMDIDADKAISVFKRYGLSYYTTDAERILADPRITLVYIASNHASHAEYAIRALEAGKSVHIEKPHVVNQNQLERLREAMQTTQGPVGLGFNRPLSRIGIEIKKALDAQTGPMMMNWFIAGHEIPGDHWYFKEEEGGRVLGNLCHWTDFVYQMMPAQGRYPIRIAPTRSRNSDCDIVVAYTFADGSIAAITFSAKGHTFEGVRERFSAHRGNALISMDDFRKLTIEVIDRKRHITELFREHGHKASIMRSFEMSKGNGGCPVEYVWETGELFLKTKEALERNESVTVDAFNEKGSGIRRQS